MSKNYVVGFPRIGEQRELKKVLERFWAQECDFSEVESVAKHLRQRHWKAQQEAGIGFISCNDFSLYDNMLDMAVLLGAIPERFQALSAEERYFAMARGNKECIALEMTKWFNTNYHYLVPELSKHTRFSLDATKLLQEYEEAKALGVEVKVNLIGPLSFLALSKRVDEGSTLAFLDELLAVYETLLQTLSTLDENLVVQFDEPIFVKDLELAFLENIESVYKRLAQSAPKVRLVVSTYFEHAKEAVRELVKTPVWAIGLDFVYGSENKAILELFAKSEKKLIAGVIDGRNIWRNDLEKSLLLLEELASVVNKEQLIIGTSCSLLHVPYSLKYEDNLDEELKSWLSFAYEKLDELSILSTLFFKGASALSPAQSLAFEFSKLALKKRQNSKRIHKTVVQERVKNLNTFSREGSFKERISLQKELLAYEDLATTTIGSFPQTPTLRSARRAFKQQEISQEAYEAQMKAYIDECIAFQEECGLEVLVHGEPERNDMVEYFGEQLSGYGFCKNAWVQSYGSRCVKPPFIYGDISRLKPMTVEWIRYAQSKTSKIMKGMLTGPVTMLNWSFVRDDILRAEVSQQLALALKDEVADLQEAGIKVIQVDEAAFKEGYPLRKSNIKTYETWAVRDFKIAVSSAKKQTQIHTHMCYSVFTDIIDTIEAMDADVISIETARSGNSLLKIFADVGYKQEVGPGVYDIHSPRIPSVEEIVTQIKHLLEVLPKEQLWINPDCGLKTRKWPEVKQSLLNMTKAVRIVREQV